MREIQVISFEGHAPPDLALNFRMLPFIVPENTSRIEVSYHCQSDLSFGLRRNENPHDYVADIAIFDPHGAEFMGKGFRGSSGNSRTTIFLAPDEASPGYTPGSLHPGEWQVMLGFYKVAPTGCDYQVTIRLTPGSSQPTMESRVRLPLRTQAARSANETGWYKGDLHCHTVHSDGDSTPAEVVRIAESLGLDFLAITDHNVQSHWADLAQIDTDLILIPGCEVTTYYGHWNIWGSGPWIDFRIQSPADLQRTIQAATAHGYLVSCNHPRPYGPDWAFPEVEGYACVETWNGPWEYGNDICRTFWETRLNAGQHLIAIGGSDFHYSKVVHRAQFAHPTTCIYCPGEPSAANLLESLRAGHAFVTESPTGPRLDLHVGSAMMGDTVASAEPMPCVLTVIDGIGAEAQLCSESGVIASFSVTETPQTFKVIIKTQEMIYVRAQLVEADSDRCLALTNPIYCRT